MSARQATGEVIGDYSVVAELDAARGLGRACLALSETTPGSQQLFLIVRVAAKGLQRANAQRELERVKVLQHPAIVPVVESFDHQGQLAVVLEYLDGLWLEQIQVHLAEAGERLSDKAIAHIGHQLMSALAMAHAAKDGAGRRLHLIHGGLGPDRIHISWDGTVRVFGIGVPALFAGADRSALSLSFRAPEQQRAQANVPQSDLFSAAAILWTLLTGQPPPADGGKLPPISTHRPDLPRRLGAALTRALDHSAARRTIGCDELSQLVAEEIEGASDPRELRWNMELFKALDLFSTVAWPPKRKRNVVEAPAKAPIVDDESSIDWSEPASEEAKPEAAAKPATPAKVKGWRGASETTNEDLPALKQSKQKKNEAKPAAASKRKALRPIAPKPVTAARKPGPAPVQVAGAAAPTAGASGTAKPQGAKSKLARMTLAQASFQRATLQDYRRQARTLPRRPDASDLRRPATMPTAEKHEPPDEPEAPPPSVPRPATATADPPAAAGSQPEAASPAPDRPQKRAQDQPPQATRKGRSGPRMDGAENEVINRLSNIFDEPPEIESSDDAGAQAGPEALEETPATPITTATDGAGQSLDARGSTDGPVPLAEPSDGGTVTVETAEVEADDLLDLEEFEENGEGLDLAALDVSPAVEPAPAYGTAAPTPAPPEPAAAPIFAGAAAAAEPPPAPKQPASPPPAPKQPAVPPATTEAASKRGINPAVAVGGMLLTGAVGFGVAWYLGVAGPSDQQPTATAIQTETPVAPAQPPSSPEPTAASEPIETGETSASEESTPDATAEPTADAEAPPAEPAADGLPPVVDELGGDGSELLTYEGYLIVRSSAKADVFVQGVHRGPTNTKLKSRCHQKFVRLRDPAGGKWLTGGQGVRIACRSVTTVTIEP